MPVQRPRNVEEAIARFAPISVGEPAAAFARMVVTQVQPDNAERAKALLFAASRLAHFALSIGLVPGVELLSDDALIERFILVGLEGRSPSTQRTLRANLRAMARHLAPPAAPDPLALARGRAKLAYSPEEIAAYLALAAAQSTLSRRMRAQGLLALAAGAGLTGADLASVRGPNVVQRSGGLLVAVSGTRPRVVPVLSKYHELLIDSARFANERPVIGSNNPMRRNMTTSLISSFGGGLDLERLDTGRLRATWLAACAEVIGLSSFMAAAGITCSQHLGDIAARVAQRSESELVVLLGGCAV